MADDEFDNPNWMVQQIFDAVFEKQEWDDFTPFFEHNSALDTLAFYAQPSEHGMYEHPVAGTNLVVMREQRTDKIVGFRVCQYSEMEHTSFQGAPN